MKTSPTLASQIRRILPMGVLLLLGNAVHAGPQGGFSLPRPGGSGAAGSSFKLPGGGSPGVSLPFKPQGGVAGAGLPFKSTTIPGGLPPMKTFPGGPIRIPQGLPGSWMSNPGDSGKNPGQPGRPHGNGVGVAIASQVLQGLVSQLGSGGFVGGGSGGGGYDSGYSGGGEVCPAPSGIVPVEAQQLASPETTPASQAAQGNTTAVQITDLNRGPAARAGLQKGDILLRVDGQRVRTVADLTSALAASRGTSAIQFVNSDDGKIENRDVNVVNGKIGVAVVEIPVQLDESEPTPSAISAKPNEETALQVTEVREGNALDAGIQVKDVILFVDGRKVATTDDLVTAFKASKGESEIELYTPSLGKGRTLTMKVEQGKIGLGLKVIPIEIR